MEEKNINLAADTPKTLEFTEENWKKLIRYVLNGFKELRTANKILVDDQTKLLRDLVDIDDKYQKLKKDTEESFTKVSEKFKKVYELEDIVREVFAHVKAIDLDFITELKERTQKIEAVLRDFSKMYKDIKIVSDMLRGIEAEETETPVPYEVVEEKRKFSDYKEAVKEYAKKFPTKKRQDPPPKLRRPTPEPRPVPADEPDEPYEEMFEFEFEE